MVIVIHNVKGILSKQPKDFFFFQVCINFHVKLKL